MKLKRDIDLGALLQAAQACRGDVLFLSSEDDRLNLKSQLCSYVFLILAKHREILNTGELLFSPEDADCLSAFVEAQRA